MTMRSGIGFDAHRFAPGRRLILGGVAIDSDMGLDGHSDADVLCHAIMDALLGAVADGDIGQHFPDTDPKWQDARSVDMLGTIADRLRAKGVEIVNVDSTIVAESPKMAPYIQAMREEIAGCLQTEVGRVSVKATTVERLGALGREEGIAALAVTMVRDTAADV